MEHEPDRGLETTHPWADQAGPVGDSRQQAYTTMQAADRFFTEAIQADGGSGPLSPLRDRFSPRELEATQSVVHGLFDLLFYQPEDIFDGKRVRARFLVQFVQQPLLDELAHYLSHSVARSFEQDPPPTAESVTDFLAKWIDSVLDGLVWGLRDSGVELAGSNSESTALGRWQERLGKLRQDFARNLTAINTATVAERAAQETLNARDAALAAAGQTGATAIGGYFSQVADRERQSSKSWTKATIASIVAVVVAGAIILCISGNSPITQTLLHLVLMLPIVGLASYTARVAKYHQILGRWAESSSVLINSMPAFAKQITDSDARERLILELSHGVFSRPVFGDEGKIEHVSPIPPDLINLLKEIAAKLPNRASG
ncbi:hypothetical protein [Mycobacteroides abscessus]|uniref:hypothetical protein n=1 Tax=Mycobacteroides abscessus TaxID=36809 RepID=UPI0019D16402|nr:hypothetical protein [Mycobacteroides abscessus]MBN7450307.1 hypothetical protein [Mycobacteroides abscessus subsp. abscessus]MDO3057111.1 hypothetical protein [Mycobacteroides abscessus subsp. abscessus]MDO3277545.1 hypothetical protein [Mycobacteroides abscessus subsp. abscessus]